jgi:hypothetical protein
MVTKPKDLYAPDYSRISWYNQVRQMDNSAIQALALRRHQMNVLRTAQAIEDQKRVDNAPLLNSTLDQVMEQAGNVLPPLPADYDITLCQFQNGARIGIDGKQGLYLVPAQRHMGHICLAKQGQEYVCIPNSHSGQQNLADYLPAQIPEDILERMLDSLSKAAARLAGGY